MIGHSNPGLGREIGQEIEIGEANEVEIEMTDAMMTDRKHLIHAIEKSQNIFQAYVSLLYFALNQ